MSWELFKYLAELTGTIIVYGLLFGAGVSGLTFVVAFVLWLYDRARKELWQ